MSASGEANSGAGISRPFSSRSSRSASRFGRQRQQQERQRAITDEHFQQADVSHQLPEDLNIRVRERDPTEDRPRSRLGSFIFKGANADSSAAPVSEGSSFEQKASELKDTLTRPLSGLFRRSQSNDRSNPSQSTTAAAGTPHSMAAAIPPALPRPAPTARGPLAGHAASLAFGASTTNKNAANGAIAGGDGVTSTTATRPFSAFPGKRAAATTTERSDAVASSHFETDLSEQAAIAPHVNIRRFSGIANDPSSLFLNRVGHQQQNNSARTARGSANRGARGEIDVNFLSRFLCPEDEIQDEQIPWIWDSLFASVTSELREEWALEEEANHNNNDPGVEMGGGGMPNGPLQQQRQGQGYIHQKGF